MRKVYDSCTFKRNHVWALTFKRKMVVSIFTLYKAEAKRIYDVDKITFLDSFRILGDISIAKIF